MIVAGSIEDVNAYGRARGRRGSPPVATMTAQLGVRPL